MVLKDPNFNLIIDIYTEVTFGKEKIKSLFPKENDMNFLESEKDDTEDLPF